MRALPVVVLILAAAGAGADDTKARLDVFQKEVGQAARELRVASPKVAVVSLDQAIAMGASSIVAAFVVETKDDSRWQVFVVWSQLMSASDVRLRCWARHEVTHVQLGHRYARDLRESNRHHDEVRLMMRARWREDSACTEDR